MPKNLIRNIILFLAIGVSGCGSSEAQVENQVVETTIDANSTTSTTLDPREIAAIKLNKWKWAPQIYFEETLRKLNLGQLEESYSTSGKIFNYALASDDSGISNALGPIGCPPIYSLSNLMSVDGVNLPVGDEQFFIVTGGSFISVSAFLADVENDSETELKRRYDKIIEAKGTSCKGNDYQFLWETAGCKELNVVPRFTEDCLENLSLGEYESNLNWLGLNPPGLDEVISETVTGSTQDIDLTTINVVRKAFTLQSSSKDSLHIREYLALILPIRYSLMIRVAILASKNKSLNFADAKEIADVIGPQFVSHALRDIESKLDN